MNDERILGRLEEFKEWAQHEFSKISLQHSVFAEKIQAIDRDRWILHGKMIVVTAVVISGIELLFHKG